MNSALIRALRTGLQTLLAAVIAFPTAHNLLDIAALGEPLLLALYVSVFAFIVSFLQNCIEQLSGAPTPRG